MVNSYYQVRHRVIRSDLLHFGYIFVWLILIYLGTKCIYVPIKIYQNLKKSNTYMFKFINL